MFSCLQKYVRRKEMKKYLVGLISGIVLVGAVSCASLSELFTPARLDKQAIKLVEEEKVVEPGEFDGYPNLDKAGRLVNAVEDATEIVALRLKQINHKVGADLENATKLEKKIFAPDGLLPLALTVLGVGPVAGLIGLMRTKPGDISKQDMELALNDVKGEVTDRDRKILELVKGVQNVLAANNGSADEIKKILKDSQSPETRELVAKLKVGL
jgi:hypothetical protein